MSTQAKVTITLIPADPRRGLIGFIGIMCASFGAGAMWGVSAFFIVFGAVIAACCVIDEAIERFTLIKRDDKV